MSFLDRQTLLATAMIQLSRGGIVGLSFRGIAAALDLTTEELQEFFENRSVLEAALAAESSQWLLTSLQTAAGTKAPKAAIQSMAQALLRFARNEPHVFSLSQKHDGPRYGASSVASELWSFVLAKVSDVYPHDKAPNAAIAFWALLVGLASFASAGSLSQAELMRCLDLGVSGWLMAALVN